VATTVLLATCGSFPDGPDDEAGLVAACAAAGVTASWAVWDDPGVDWASADLVVVRATWDYTDRREAFVDWAAGVPHLANPVAQLAWSSDKTYLLELAAAGVPVVPTRVLADPDDLPDLGGADLVVKPSVGAGSVGAGRFPAGDPSAPARARAHAADLRAHGRTALAQPYLDTVDDRGETDLVFLGGTPSHAVRKAALLDGATVNPLDGPGAAELFVPERIRPTTPTDAELRVAAAALAAAPGPHPPLYARVDLLPGPDGPVVNEVELVEPSLFLGHAPGSVDRLAARIATHPGLKPGGVRDDNWR
jgi:glutathione synthase/RimK-type ligase-like ATP-grasp enzyme